MSNIFILDVNKGWFLDLFRTILAYIDTLVYTIIAIFFRTIFNLANFELVGFYEEFEERVFVILGIFMLFKVTISLITYLVDPDKITDKQQGASKIVTKVITVLVMLVLLPTFFNLLTEFQNKLLPVIPRVIIGSSNAVTNDSVGGVADQMAITMFQGFAHKKDGCDGDEIQSVGDIVDHINDSCSDSNKKKYKYDYLPLFSTLVGLLACYVLFSLCITVAIRAFKLIILRMIAPIPIISYVDPKSSKDGAFSSWRKLLISTWTELFILLAIIYFVVFMIDFMLSGNAWRGFFDNIGNGFEGAVLFAFLIVGLLFFARQAPQFIFDALGIKSKGSFVRMLGMGTAALGGIGSARAAYRARQEYDAENRPGESHRLRNIGASLFSGLAGGISGGSSVLSSDKPNLMTGFDAMAKSNATALSRINSGSTLGGRIGAIGQSIFLGETTADINERKIKNMEEFNKALGAIGSRAKDEMVKQDWTAGNLGSFSLLDSEGNVMYDENGVARTISDIKANFKSFKAAKDAAAAAGRDFFQFSGYEKNAAGQWVETVQTISMNDANLQEGFLLKNNEDDYIAKQVELMRAEDKTKVRSINGRSIADKYDSVIASHITDAEERAVAVSDDKVTQDYYVDGKFQVSGRDSVKKTQDAISIDSTQLQRENARHVANRRGQGNKGN